MKLTLLTLLKFLCGANLGWAIALTLRGGDPIQIVACLTVATFCGFIWWRRS
jgi:hypothetical protein